MRDEEHISGSLNESTGLARRNLGGGRWDYWESGPYVGGGAALLIGGTPAISLELTDGCTSEALPATGDEQYRHFVFLPYTVSVPRKIIAHLHCGFE